MMQSSVRRSVVLWVMCFLAIAWFWTNDLFSEAKPSQPEFTFHIGLNQKNCQMAVWLVDEQGDFVDTVLVTRKVAQKGLGNRGGKLDDRWGGSRLSVLPVWAHQRGVDYGGGNFYPSKDNPLVDAISSATPKAGQFVWAWRSDKPFQPGKYFFFVEVNKSFDDNAHHDYSWYRGQPSVIWRGSLLIGEGPYEGKAEVIGHGHVAGADGKINPDLTTLTTALELINAAKVIYNPGVRP